MKIVQKIARLLIVALLSSPLAGSETKEEPKGWVLPNDLMEHCFRFFDASDVAHVICACKSWKGLADTEQTWDIIGQQIDEARDLRDKGRTWKQAVKEALFARQILSKGMENWDADGFNYAASDEGNGLLQKLLLKRLELTALNEMKSEIVDGNLLLAGLLAFSLVCYYETSFAGSHASTPFYFDSPWYEVKESLLSIARGHLGDTCKHWRASYGAAYSLAMDGADLDFDTPWKICEESMSRAQNALEAKVSPITWEHRARASMIIVIAFLSHPEHFKTLFAPCFLAAKNKLNRCFWTTRDVLSIFSANLWSNREEPELASNPHVAMFKRLFEKLASHAAEWEKRGEIECSDSE